MSATRSPLWAALALTCWASAVQATAAAPDTLAHPALLSRSDAAFALGAVAAVALAAPHDLAWSQQAAADRTGNAHDLAAFGRQFGEPVVMATALLAADAATRLSGHDRMSAATERVALAAAGASIVTVMLKEVVGRWRPNELPVSVHRFTPFSRHDAFPSGHTTLAFALASGICSEAHARWLPAAVYPIAGLTAWSRLHDRQHWPSDVVAGAAIGTWVAAKVDRVARERLPHGLRVLVLPTEGGALAAAGVTF